MANGTDNGNSHSSIDNLIDMNDLKQWWESAKGKNIFGQEVSPVTEEELLMMIMPPGSAIGRLSKAAITGGQATPASIMQGGLKNILKYLKNPNSGKLRVRPSGKGLETINPKIEQIKWDNKINAARIKAQKVFDKNKIPHETEVVDPVSALLNFIKN